MKKIVAFSDWHFEGHGYINDEVVMFPEADALLFAGDVTGQISPFNYKQQLIQFHQFLFNELLPVSDKYEYIICVFGNHDKGFEVDEYNIEKFHEYVDKFNKESKKAQLLWNLEEKMYDIYFSDGENLKVFASPYSHKIWEDDPWGFHFETELSKSYWEFIGKAQYDIVLSHTPVYGYGDKVMYPNGRDPRVGTKWFDNWEHKPQVFISGHIHEGYGVYEGKDKWEGTTFINCSLNNYDYIVSNDMIEFEIEGLNIRGKEKENE